MSHNHRDKDFARPLAAQLRLAGADVRIDEWDLRPGDSIPGWINEALAIVDTVMVIWSENASRSRWVGGELDAALARKFNEDGFRIIPVVLDATPLPTLLQSLLYVPMNSPKDATDKVMGFGSDREFIKAVQQTLEEAGFDLVFFPGYGPAVGCPRCGAPSRDLEGWEATDWERDDVYAGVKCGRCGWQDGGEI